MSRKIRLTKVRAGEWATLDGKWRIVKDWGETPGWTICRLWVETNDTAIPGFCDILSTHRTLREALSALDQPPVA